MFNYLKNFIFEEEDNKPKEEETTEKELEKDEEMHVSERELFNNHKTFRFPVIGDEGKQVTNNEEYHNTGDYRFNKNVVKPVSENTKIVTEESTQVKVEVKTDKKQFKPLPVFSLRKGFLDSEYQLPKREKHLPVEHETPEAEVNIENLKKARDRIYQGEVEEIYNTQEQERVVLKTLFDFNKVTIDKAEKKYREDHVVYEYEKTSQTNATEEENNNYQESSSPETPTEDNTNKIEYEEEQEVNSDYYYDDQDQHEESELTDSFDDNNENQTSQTEYSENYYQQTEETINKDDKDVNNSYESEYSSNSHHDKTQREQNLLDIIDELYSK